MALTSMTGYGMSGDKNSYTVEIKSVNHKYLEIRTHLPADLLSLEPRILEHMRKRVRRGSIDISVTRGNHAPSVRKPRLNLDAAKAYLDISGRISKETGMMANLDIGTLLSFKDVIDYETDQVETEAILAHVLSSTDDALKRFEEMKAREGAAITNVLQSYLASIESFLKVIEEEAKGSVEVYRERLKVRISQIKPEVEIDTRRLEQEIAFLAERSDITEEIERLKSHIGQFRSLFSSNSSCGKKMDFVLQEMNREINTIGSKSQSLPISHLVIDVKSELDKMREQVQNAE
jgi:uncharacterized protein (TIGR00255 family)